MGNELLSLIYLKKTVCSFFHFLMIYIDLDFFPKFGFYS